MPVRQKRTYGRPCAERPEPKTERGGAGAPPLRQDRERRFTKKDARTRAAPARMIPIRP